MSGLGWLIIAGWACVLAVVLFFVGYAVVYRRRPLRQDADGAVPAQPSASS